MTDEEKKAIEYFKENINYFQEQIKFIETVDCDYYDEEYKLYKNRVKQFNTILNLIQKQQAELEKKDKIIDLMERFIADLDIDEDICKHQVAEFCEGTDGVSLDICVKCINQYFEKKVEGII